MSSQAVYQFAPQVSSHDAISNEMFAVHGLLSASGIESHITCHLADAATEGAVERWSEQSARRSRLTIVHYSHGAQSHEQVFASAEPKALFYHNITPAHYFQSTHPNLVRASEIGRAALTKLPDEVEVAVAHSTFSADELRRYGFHRVEVLPYIPLDSLYEMQPDQSVLQHYGFDNRINIICVAHVSPHKCIEDCILIFHYFKNHVNPNSRLILVGGWGGTEAYLARLQRLIKSLHLADVIFTGQVAQASLNAYYKTAHAFLCMSEHEGFCVPLIEAMRYDVPVFAYASTAIPETLRHSGVLFSEKDWPTIAEAIGCVLSDPRRLEHVVAGQRERLSYYSMSASRARLMALLASLGISAKPF